ncbi:hypothetical protein KF913_23880 [Candidatus Obscuribacterales bacterium]|nr:hypothetical protein [Candidatus Obscuribacterales bacterium]
MKRITGFFLASLLLIAPVCLITDGGSCGAVYGKTTKKSSSGRTSKKSTSTKASKSSTSSRKSSTRTSRSSSKGKSSRSATTSSRGKGHGKSKRETVARGSRARHVHHHHHEEPKEAAKPAPPSPEQVEANNRRESSYQTMARAYRLYDEGINARMRGDYSSAVGKLTESWKLFNDARGYQRTGEPSINEALVHYELGQAAEGARDILTARDSYMRCLNIRPTFVEASVSLVNMLAASGQWQLALAKAQDAVRNSPNDPRVHKLWALTLDKTGHSEEARHEANKAQECLKYVPRYKPMGIDAVWKRTHHEDGSVKSGAETEPAETVSPGQNTSSGKSDVDNPEDVMGVEEEPEEEE